MARSPAARPPTGGIAPAASPAAASAHAPVYSAEIEARGGDALFRADNLPQGGALAPTLQRSGQWLQQP
jgi:hypothetical protein